MSSKVLLVIGILDQLYVREQVHIGGGAYLEQMEQLQVLSISQYGNVLQGADKRSHRLLHIPLSTFSSQFHVVAHASREIVALLMTSYNYVIYFVSKHTPLVDSDTIG